MAEPPGVTIAPVAPRSIAGIGIFRDSAPLHAALREELGIEIPDGARFAQAGPIRLSRLAPTRLLVSDERDAALPSRLARLLDGVAAITDQSDLWTTSLLSGPGVREALSRLVPIDLHRFAIGDLALTRAGQLDVRVWRIAEDDYELAVGRSFVRPGALPLDPAKGSRLWNPFA